MQLYHVINRLSLLSSLFLSVMPWYGAVAVELHVAVAGSFVETLQQLKPLFEQETGHTLIITTNSVSVLYQKIKNNEIAADIFLSADEEHPNLLIKEKLAIPESFFVYAVGRLILWTKSLPIEQLNQKSLLKINTISLPDPKITVYGHAAQQILEGLKLWELIQPKIRLTRTVNEAYQNTQNNQTEAGFIGLAQYLSSLDNLGTTYWIIPQYLYEPLTQGAVILSSTQHLAAAQDFLKFLQHPDSLKIIREFGFRTHSQFMNEQQDD